MRDFGDRVWGKGFGITEGTKRLFVTYNIIESKAETDHQYHVFESRYTLNPIPHHDSY